MTDERVKEIAELVEHWETPEIYGWGCCLHIVTEDFNFERHHIESCAEDARARGHEKCAEVADALLELSHEQLHKALTLEMGECSICHHDQEGNSA